jgi:hypothetical protein
MTATDELRRLLDERGVEWWPNEGDPAHITERVTDGVRYKYRQIGHRLIVSACTEGTITPEQAIAATLGPQVTGETSDGYHTFNELYHHRAVLFSVIVRDHHALAWKAKKHHDGTMYDGMFIVGIDTPEGQATYHYDIDPYWGMFECRELEAAPEWDGHTPDDAIARIATLGADAKPTQAESSGTCNNASKVMDEHGQARFACSECGAWIDSHMLWNPEYPNGESPWVRDCKLNFCPNCGRRIVEVDA